MKAKGGGTVMWHPLGSELSPQHWLRVGSSYQPITNPTEPGLTKSFHLLDFVKTLPSDFH